MTKNEAYKIIGVPLQANLKKAENTYQQKCKKLRFKTLPGNPANQRQRAQRQLLRLQSHVGAAD